MRTASVLGCSRICVAPVTQQRWRRGGSASLGKDGGPGVEFVGNVNMHCALVSLFIVELALTVNVRKTWGRHQAPYELW